MSKTIEFTGEYHVRVGDWDFHCEFPQRRRPEGHLPIAKSFGGEYIALCAAEQPKVIFELGIRGGGSTALLCELAEPSKLIAIEINPRPVEMLDDYIAQAGVADRVRACYGVDQSDRSRLAEIVAAELDGRPIDLVIDDASHRLAETRSSFETCSRTSARAASSSSRTGPVITSSPIGAEGPWFGEARARSIPPPSASATSTATTSASSTCPNKLGTCRGCG